MDARPKESKIKTVSNSESKVCHEIELRPCIILINGLIRILKIIYNIAYFTNSSHEPPLLKIDNLYTTSTLQHC